MKRLRALAVAAALALAAAPVVADPTSLISAAVYYAAGQGAVGAIAAIAVTIIGAYYQNERARRKSRDAFNASLADRTITVRGAAEPRRMVLGRQRVGGVVAFIASTGVNKEKLVMVIALAAHECDAIETIYFNDTPVTLDGEGVTSAPYGITAPVSVGEEFTGDGATATFTLSRVPNTGTVAAVQTSGSGQGFESTPFTVTGVSGANVTVSPPPLGPFTIGYQYSNTSVYARVRKFLGAPGQTVDATVQSLFPGAWTSTHPMSGCAGLAVFLDYNEDVFQSEVQVSAVVRGAKVYDPRKDSTAGGSGAHRVGNPATWEWSENPALLIGYAAMSELCGRQPASAINWTDVAVAANVCDAQVDYTTWGQMADEDGEFLTDENGEQLLV